MRNSIAGSTSDFIAVQRENTAARLLSTKGRRWLDRLALDQHVRALVDAHVAMIDTTTEQMAELERQLRRLARSDRRLVVLQQIYGVGPVVACHLLAEIGDARRFRRADQIIRVAGRDPVVLESPGLEAPRQTLQAGLPAPALRRSSRPPGRPPPRLKPRRRPLPGPGCPAGEQASRRKASSDREPGSAVSRRCRRRSW